MRTAALARAVGRASARRGATGERCGLCDAPVDARHRHLLDTRDGGVSCACPACVLLFGREAAGGGRYQLIPQRRLRLPWIDTEPLDVPVGLAFFVKQPDGRVLARYPSPLGTTESEVDAAVWRAVADRSPELAGLRPQVEALLVRTSGGVGRDQLWLLPVDDCYRLVAVIRRTWRGMSGGSAVWREVARFFDDLPPSSGTTPPGRPPT